MTVFCKEATCLFSTAVSCETAEGLFTWTFKEGSGVVELVWGEAVEVWNSGVVLVRPICKVFEFLCRIRVGSQNARLECLSLYGPGYGG